MERIVEREVSMKILSFGSLNIDYVYKVSHFVKKRRNIVCRRVERIYRRKRIKPVHCTFTCRNGNISCRSDWHGWTILLDQLKEAGVNTDLVKILEDVRTGNAIIQNDEEGDNCIILFGGANQAISKEQVDEVFENFKTKIIY